MLTVGPLVPRPSFLGSSVGLALTLAVLAPLVLAGCGRKATREDCATWVDRNIELQLKAQGVTDPGVVGRKRAELVASMEKDIEECVGKRVTDSMMSCINTAQTSEQLDKCLR